MRKFKIAKVCCLAAGVLLLAGALLFLLWPKQELPKLTLKKNR